MKDSPPENLVDLLTGLGLATAAEVQGASGRARRLAGDLPLFESLWIDALAQARLLTPWQAVEISAGRGSALRVGPFVLYERLATFGYATLYRAREIEARDFVRLIIAAGNVGLKDAERHLAQLVAKADQLATVALSPVVRWGMDDGRLWVASDWFVGRTARQWMMGHGRFPPASVHDIARQMLVGLTACERAGVPHADLGIDQLWFDAQGQVRLPEPGLRRALRPLENGGEGDLPAEAYDYLSPVRAAKGTMFDARGDVYACGALWWHLLAGRPPFAGATARIKVHNIQTARLPDIRQVVPDMPEPLAEMVMQCLARDAQQRPDSLAAIAETLGEPSARGGKRLARLVRSDAGRRRFRFAAHPWRRAPQTSTWVAVATGIVLAAVIIAWPAISPRLDELAADTPPRTRAAMTMNAHASLPTTDATPSTNGGRAVRRKPGTLPAQNLKPIAASSAAPNLADTAADGDAELQNKTPVVPMAWNNDEKVLNFAAGDPPIDFAQLATGQTLRGNPERRPLIDVPPEGIEILPTGVTIENVDFVARQPLDDDAAMLTLRGLKTVLRGCSFQTAGDFPQESLPAAIHWDRDVESENANAELATGELQLYDVAFRRVACGATCHLTAGMVLRWENVLCLEVGSAVQFDCFPSADELALLSMSRVALRGARSLVEVGCDEMPEAAGHLEIEAVDCAFVLPAAAALIVFDGQQRPGPLLHGLRWSGQGSVLSPRSHLAIWRMPEGRMLAAADDAVPIVGVVRGEVGFAGLPADSAAGSRIIRWQAPLTSAHPPGIDAAALSLPPLVE